MRKIAFGLPFLGIAVALAASCSKAAPPPVVGPTAETYLSTYDDALCAYLVKCGQIPDAASCAKYIGEDPGVAQAISSVVFGKLQFDATAATSCIAAFKSATCESLYRSGTLQADLATACDAVFTGKGGTGANCYVDLECASGVCKPPTDCGDVCCVSECVAPLTEVAAGTKCMATADCSAADYCDATTMVCTVRDAANALCDQDDACIKGFACDKGSGKCFELAAAGATCNPALSTNPCSEVDQFCNPTTMKCADLPRAGSPCVAMGPSMGACAPEAVCDMTKTCQLLPTSGQPCVGGLCLGSIICSPNGMVCENIGPAYTCVPEATGASTSAGSGGAGGSK